METATWEVTQAYVDLISKEGKAILVAREKEVTEQWENKFKGHVAEEVDRVIDIDVTRTGETLYHNTMDTMWHMKILMGKFIEETET